MELSKQVCSLEQAKKLKELGIEQKSLYGFYHKGDFYCGSEYAKKYVPAKKSTIEAFSGESVDFPYKFDGCCFTVAELGVMLPPFPEWNWETYYHSGEELYECQSAGKHLGQSRTEAQGRALILVHLLETNTVTAAECNERLAA